MYENPSPVCVYIVCRYGDSLCLGKLAGGLKGKVDVGLDGKANGAPPV